MNLCYVVTKEVKGLFDNNTLYFDFVKQEFTAFNEKAGTQITFLEEEAKSAKVTHADCVLTVFTLEKSS